MSAEVIVAIVSGFFTLCGVIVTVLVGNNKTTYRIQKLEEKVQKHNNLVERMYKVEGQIHEINTKINNDDRRLNKLENSD